LSEAPDIGPEMEPPVPSLEAVPEPDPAPVIAPAPSGGEPGEEPAFRRLHHGAR
jgi:hypothetical protein